MSRHTHVWFIAGMMLSLAITFCFWLTALAAGAMWSTTWGPIVPLINAGIFAWAAWKWRERRIQRQIAQKLSRELRCPEFRGKHDHHAVGFMAMS